MEEVGGEIHRALQESYGNEKGRRGLMTIKAKLTLFIVVFLVLIAAFVAGSFLIFESMSVNFDVLRSSSEVHNLHEELKTSIIDFVMAAEGWGVTGNATFKRQYRERLGIVYKNFGALNQLSADSDELKAIGKDFEELKGVADKTISTNLPVGNRNVLSLLRLLEEKDGEIRGKLDSLHLKSVRLFSAAIDRGEKIKGEMAFYLGGLFIVSSLAFLLLALFMRRMIAVPFNDILTATDRISSGDLDYRIGSERNDEFGVIAHRFDRMVGDLQKANEKNVELYLSTRNQLQKLRAMYELAKAITSTLDLDELLGKMAQEATSLLHARGCIIRLLEDGNLAIRASYGLPREIEKMMTLPVGEGLPGKVAKEGRPILVEDLSTMPPDWQIPHLDARSVINVPLMVGGTVTGTLGLYDKMAPGDEIIPFSGDDLSTAEGFASLCAIAIEKAKMFELERRREREAVEARKRLDILFDSVQGGIMTVGKGYEILSANRYVETWMGRSVDGIIGKSCTDVFHERRGICPHCVAQVTFETGEINVITQVSGLNYAELTSYPVKDEQGNVVECVVFILDITDRVLYQEEMLALYREVTQTKEYLESLIDNSADAIVTSDLNGIVTSWNQGAERIYGFSEEEALGKFLPFVPDFLKETEKEHTERVKNGEVLKDIETVRRRSDGTIIEVSLTLSPIKDASGGIIGVSGISRDISGKKAVEKELIKRNQELSRLFFISSAMRSTLDLDRLLRMILTAVTMGDGLGFNRAVLFLMDEGRNVLRGTMGVGPSSFEEAGRVWERLSREKKTLNDVMLDIESGPKKEDTFLDRLSLGIEISLDNGSIIASSVKEKRPFNVTDARKEPSSDAVLIQQLGTEAYAVVPLISRDKVIGVLFVDNLFNKKPISDEDMRFLSAFSNQMAAAIESAKLFEQVSFAEAELENIFRSISDMVYFTDMDYTIRSVNKAVSERLGLPEEEVVGKKCYEVFHNMNEPWEACPHHKTVETKKSFIEEVDDPRTGETFLSSTSPIFDMSGKFMGSVHIVRDITELKQIGERLATAERMAALGEVAAKVAHEIRNPLVSIGGFAQRLENKLDGNLKEYATIIAREVKRLEDILRDILGFVKEVRLSIKAVDVTALMQNVLSLVGSEAVERGITLEGGFTDVPEVLVDPDRMKEAFLNIMNNSIQAVGMHGKITTKTYAVNGNVVVEISDSGTGIAEKDLPFIFDPFYTTKPTGTGLGLAITRRIIEEHKGRIEVKSRPGEGTTIKVSLPSKRKEER
jgi:PAS domain S-box-containing protein